ncbi:hypothetical protein R3P38DRAFT_2809469 [Favolaschia claudopus]|uniref:Uncharacterized protein n=1 Tax=Favolaschia claudopus TaxID=2862362 RepID=A0AAV9ZCY2_9AGAR
MYVFDEEVLEKPSAAICGLHPNPRAGRVTVARSQGTSQELRGEASRSPHLASPETKTTIRDFTKSSPVPPTSATPSSPVHHPNRRVQTRLRDDSVGNREAASGAADVRRSKRRYSSVPDSHSVEAVGAKPARAPSVFIVNIETEERVIKHPSSEDLKPATSGDHPPPSFSVELPDIPLHPSWVFKIEKKMMKKGVGARRLMWCDVAAGRQTELTSGRAMRCGNSQAPSQSTSPTTRDTSALGECDSEAKIRR